MHRPLVKALPPRGCYIFGRQWEWLRGGCLLGQLSGDHLRHEGFCHQLGKQRDAEVLWRSEHDRMDGWCPVGRAKQTLDRTTGRLLIFSLFRQLVVLKFYFESMYYSTEIQSKMGLFDFLCMTHENFVVLDKSDCLYDGHLSLSAQIGGWMSLALGASMFSILEMFYFKCCFITIFFRNLVSPGRASAKSWCSNYTVTLHINAYHFRSWHDFPPGCDASIIIHVCSRWSQSIWAQISHLSQSVFVYPKHVESHPSICHAHATPKKLSIVQCPQSQIALPCHAFVINSFWLTFMLR